MHSGRIIYFDVKIKIYFQKIKKVCIVLLSMVMLSQKCCNGLGLHLGVFWLLFGTLFLILEQKDPRMQLLTYVTFLGPYDIAKRNITSISICKKIFFNLHIKINNSTTVHLWPHFSLEPLTTGSSYYGIL